ncbi:MAG: DUF4397 domain-containing protein [Myxococcota bacterium]|jgi:hypothetical protein|nr:DUF4397 domain-containing protein [Myxococcota bacterium]
MSKNHNLRSLQVAILSVSAFGLAGAACESPDDISGPAYVRVVHLAQSVGAVDVQTDGGYSFDLGAGFEPAPAVGADEVRTAIAQNLAFRTSTGYVPVLPGDAVLEARSAGIRFGEPLFSIQADLRAGLRYTVVVLETERGPSTLVLNDEEWEGQGTAARFVHAAESLPGVDVWVTSASGDAERIANRVSAGQVVGYFQVETGARLALDADRDGAPDAVFDLAQLSDSGSLSLFAIVAAGRVTLLAQRSAGELSVLPTP